MSNNDNKSILLTGATGYIGGRLLKILEAEKFQLRCLAREPSYLLPKVSESTEIFQGDVLNRSSLKKAFEGIDTAFYLIHSMGSASGFQEKDQMAAYNFSKVARDGGVKRIIYLGGLGDEREDLSPHLKSRQEVGEILRNSGVLTIELRASIVIGSGSLSFEMIRSLTEKLPIMIMPRWVKVLAQPIGIEDLLLYLKESIYLNIEKSLILEIGGADQLSYFDLMSEYAKQRGLKRIMIPVPVLTPYLSSLWLGLVTPLYSRIGRKLIDSIRHPTIVREKTADQLFSIRPRSAKEAIASALRNEDKKFAESNWFDSLSSVGIQNKSFGGLRVGSRLVDKQEIKVNVSVEKAFLPISNIGGKTGWYAYNYLWRLRGILDLLLGGVGMRRGRPERRLRTGDPIDFWRIESIKPPYHLRLLAEMKLPGKAWLEFEVIPEGFGCKIRQTAIFYPKGLAGILYWYSMYPLHSLVFKGMIKEIVRIALQENYH